MAREVTGNRAVMRGQLKPIDPKDHFKPKKPFDIIMESAKEASELADAGRELAKTTRILGSPKSITERTD